ncbi:MAG: RNA-binding protein [Alphaproteobacteria bacterium]|nr:RNA-binding protein [Alphaproteobacteria bacterium]
MAQDGTKKRKIATGEAVAGGKRCVVSGRHLPRAEMIRFVAGPDGVVVADLDQRLPGRGLWLAAEREILAAASGRHFAKALRRPVEVPPDLAQRVEAGLVLRGQNLIGLARRAGVAVAGFEKVRAALSGGTATLLVGARDGAADGRRKLAGAAAGIARAEGLTAAELGAVFGRDAVVHVAILDTGFTRPIEAALTLLDGVRGPRREHEEIPVIAQVG